MNISKLRSLMRAPTGKTSIVKIDPDEHRRKIGFGGYDLGRARTHADGLGAGIKAIGLGQYMSGLMGCPSQAMDTIHQVRWTLSGPITPSAIEKNFSAEIDLFANSKSVEGVSFVESTMPQNGELNTHMLACSVGMHLEPEPHCWTVQGNAWTHHTVPAVRPISPDVFTIQDLASGALGAAFQNPLDDPAEVLLPSVLEWGWWANYVAWHMVRAYNLRWAIGTKNNIIDEVLRHTAYMPPAAQDGSASSSQVDILAAVRRTNDYYDKFLGSALDFLKIDALRLGAVAGSGLNEGDFRPSRAFEVVGVTYGGGDLRAMLRNNSEFRKINNPYIIGAGIPIGLRLDEVDDVQGDIMRDYLDATQGRQGNGAIPAVIFDSNGVAPGATGSAPELTFECGTSFPCSFPINFRLFAERILYKMGDLKISLLVKGWELDGDTYQTLLSDPKLREALCDECGCKFAMQ